MSRSLIGGQGDRKGSNSRKGNSLGKSSEVAHCQAGTGECIVKVAQRASMGAREGEELGGKGSWGPGLGCHWGGMGEHQVSEWEVIWSLVCVRNVTEWQRGWS